MVFIAKAADDDDNNTEILPFLSYTPLSKLYV